MLYEIILEDAQGNRLGAAFDDLKSEYVPIVVNTTSVASQIRIFRNRVLRFTFQFSETCVVQRPEVLYFSAADIRKEMQ